MNNKNKRGTVKISQIVVAMIMFGMVVTGLVFFYTDTAVRYGGVVTDEQSKFFNITNNTIGGSYELSTDIQEKVESGSGLSAVEGATILASSTIEAIKMPFRMISWIVNMMGVVSSEVGLPEWAIMGIISLITIGIVFAVVSAWLRKDA